MKFRPGGVRHRFDNRRHGGNAGIVRLILGRIDAIHGLNQAAVRPASIEGHGIQHRFVECLCHIAFLVKWGAG